MVTTRSQAAKLLDRTHGRPDDCPSDDRSSSVDSTSLSTSPLQSKRRGGEASTVMTAAAASRGTEPSPGVEQLGRGCRVTRSVTSLDEEYLRRALQRNHSAFKRGRGSTAEEAAPFEIHQRYPPREAAQRAMKSLQATLMEMDDLDDDDDEDAEAVVRQVEKGRNYSSGADGRPSHPRRQAFRAAASSSDSDDEDDPRPHAKKDAEGSRSRRPLSSPASAFVSRTASFLRPASPSRRRRQQDIEVASVDSSITDASMREESMEVQAIRDRHADPSISSSGNDEDQDASMTEAARRHAMSQAKQSAQENNNINYYMKDAIQEVDPAAVRRRALDRRYRHLFFAEEDKKLAAEENGGSGGASTGAAVGADITPLRVDTGVSFDSVGGLPEHILTLREMVLLPLLYPDIFRRLNLQPPRGVLFVGPPGTGKTLMARALANEGSKIARTAASQQGITFFMRKGADILSKWVGESERQLKLLFEEAKRLQPSIIFFDELDGLAPMRHTKTEQTQAALVATLLALLDGLEDRGQVIVIGATNRPDTLDPALRRPGRFDRELVFPLPDAAARKHILSIQLDRQVSPTHPLPDQAALVEDLVDLTIGYSGADIQALCTEANLRRLRSAAPQLYLSNQRLKVPAAMDAMLQVRREDFYAAAQLMRPSMRRTAAAATGGSAGAYLEEHVEILTRSPRDAILSAVAVGWPMVERVLNRAKRDCRDMAVAVQRLCEVPLPQPPRPCVLVLQAKDVHGARGGAAERRVEEGMLLHHVGLSLMKGLSGLHVLTVHLPQLVWGDESLMAAALSPSAAAEALNGGTNYLQGGQLGDFQTFAQVVQAAQQCCPCAVYLCGAEEWLLGSSEKGEVEEEDASREDSSAERITHSSWTKVKLTVDQRCRVRALRYYMNLLANVDVLFCIPWPSDAAPFESVVLGVNPNSSAATPSSPAPCTGTSRAMAEVVCLRNCPTGLLHSQYSVACACIAAKPAAKDVRRLIRYIHRTVAMAIGVQDGVAEWRHSSMQWEIDPAAPRWRQSSSQQEQQHREDRQQRLSLWRKVEYRRLQLRHVLLKLVSQYLSSAKYKLLTSANLDFTPEHPLFADWQRHTRGRRIGLEDIFEKIENQEYVCLSQYNTDVDLMTRNVRSFFRTRATQDLRYRVKALDLKEASVLAMYKLNRHVVRFCEEHRDTMEPSSSSDDEEEVNRGGRNGKAEETEAATSRKSPLSFSQRPPTVPSRKRRRFYSERRRRRRRPTPLQQQQQETATEVAVSSAESHSDAEEEASGVVEPLLSAAAAAAVLHQRPGHQGPRQNGAASSPRLAMKETPLDTGETAPTLVPLKTLEDWAYDCLEPLSYANLHIFFKRAMRILEVELRSREDRIREHQGRTTVVLPKGVSPCRPATPPSSPRLGNSTEVASTASPEDVASPPMAGTGAITAPVASTAAEGAAALPGVAELFGTCVWEAVAEILSAPSQHG